MATGTSGRSNGFLYLIGGALVVGVIVLGVMFFNERNDSPLENAAEAVSEAADEVGDAARKSN